jgi:tetratricopeptide (TPR) repeat protein
VENNAIMVAARYIEQATVLANNMDGANAMLLLNKGDAILQEINQKRPEVIELKACSWETKAHIYKHTGREDKSVEALKMAIDLRRSCVFENKFAQNQSYIAMATSYFLIKDIKKAVACADKALDLLISNGSSHTKHDLYSLFQIYRADADYRKTKRALLAIRAKYAPNGPVPAKVMVDVCQTLSMIAFECEHDVNKANLELTRAWGFAAEVSNEDDDPNNALMLIEIYKNAKVIFTSEEEEYWAWDARCMEVFGVMIDRGQENLEIASTFVISSLKWLIQKSKSNVYATSDRLLRCLAVIEKDPAAKAQLPFTQWIAGVALNNTDKTREGARKSIRLIKTALRALKTDDSDIGRYACFIGSGVIANYYFQREEYDLAADWYRETIKPPADKNSKFYKETSEKIAECERRM